jgi:hypothetical protein
MIHEKTMPGSGVTAVTLALTGLGVFLTGLGAGITLTLLFTPLSGSDTRKLIGDAAKDSEIWVKDRAHAAEEYVLASGARARDRAREAAEAIGRD